jgi:FixJ family two-component response regulator
MSQNKTNEATVFLVDDDEAICQSLSWLLGAVGLTIEYYHSAQEYLDKYNPNRRGCLLLDIRMPHMSGLELQEELNARHSKIPIIMITGHGDIPMAVRAIKAGAMDFISKPFNDQILLSKIQKAIAYDLNRVDDGLDPITIKQRISALTTREREIMDLVVSGKLNKQIADELNISMKTVELHRSHVMQKMQVRSLAELVKMTVVYEESKRMDF